MHIRFNVRLYEINENVSFEVDVTSFSQFTLIYIFIFFYKKKCRNLLHTGHCYLARELTRWEILLLFLNI